MTDGLTSKHCVPCRGGVPALAGDDLRTLQDELGGGWQVLREHHLHMVFSFPDFVTALEFTNRVGELAEAEGHHPDIRLTWGRVEIEIFTHKIDGLTESDFILAAHIDRV